MTDDDQPREYDRDFTKPVTGPVQIRIALSTERGYVTRFLVQLEYRFSDRVATVVRYDHDGTGESEQAHDVREEGLHVDIYRDGEKVDTESVSGPLPPADAFDLAEEHLNENLENYIDRFQRWHGITDR